MLEIDIAPVLRWVSQWPVTCDDFEVGKAPSCFRSGTFGVHQTSIAAVLRHNHAETAKKSSTERRKPGANQELLLRTVARQGSFDLRDIAGDDFARRRALQICARKLSTKGLLSYQSVRGRLGYTLIGPPPGG